LEEASAENARVEQEVIILRNKVYGVSRTMTGTNLAVINLLVLFLSDVLTTFGYCVFLWQRKSFEVRLVSCPSVICCAHAYQFF